MSIQALNWVLKQDELANSGAKFVLMILANFSDEDGVCYPSQTTIARLTAMTDRSVRNHLDALARDGYITRALRRFGSRRSTDEYRLLLDRVEVESQPEEFAGSAVLKHFEPETPAGSGEAETPAASAIPEPENSAPSTGKLRQPEPENSSAHKDNHQRDPSEETQACVRESEPERRYAGRGPMRAITSSRVLPEVADAIAFGRFRDDLEDWYCREIGLVTLPPNAVTAEQVTWLYENKFTLDEIRAFYKDAKGEKWRSGRVNLGAIVKGIAEWRADRKATSADAPDPDYSWCLNKCDPKTGLVQYKDGRKKCEHRGEKKAA